MTKSKSTKKALLASAVSLILCFSMLLGTTYAWFTDSVTSAGNKIVAGTLEVDLLMADASGEYKSIADEDAAIFGADSLVAKNDISDTLWEPGKTQIAYLGVENKGNLDLKYNILLNVIDGGLVGSLEYAIIDGFQYGAIDTDTTSWATLKAAAQTGDVVAGTTTAAPNGAIQAAEGEERAIDYFALAIHMKEEAGNEYQGKDITVDVTVAATQLASEEDSFNNQYDKAAAWDGVVPDTMPETLVVDGETQIVHVKDAAAFAYLSTLSEEWVGLYTDGNGAEYSNYVNGKGANYYYSGQWTISLETDLNLMNYPIEPVSIVIGANCGNTLFDGKNHTIYNINTTTGLFKDFTRANYANLVLENVTASNGALAGIASSSITNVTVKNAKISGTDYVGGLVGKTYSSMIDCKVIDSSVTATGKEAGGLVGYAETNAGGSTISGNTVKNVSVFANNRAAGLVAQPNVNIDVYNNTVDTVTVVATDTSEYQPGAVVSNALAPANVRDNTYVNVTVKGGASTSMGDSDANVTVPEEVDLPDDATFFKSEPQVDNANKTITFDDISFKDADGNEVDLSDNTTPITVTLDVPFATNGEAYDIYHDDDLIATAIVSGGKVTYECLHFCEVKVSASKLTPVGTADELIAALEAGNGVIFTADIKIDPANMSNAYGKTGINVKKGQTIDGNGYTLNIKGAGGTWDSGINTTGGIIRNLKVTGSFRGIFVNHNSDYSGTVVLENVIIEGTTYTISCDQGMNQNLEAYNCTFNGWTSYAATLGTAKFVDCSFGEGNGYAYCRPYAPTEFAGCSFEAGYGMDPCAAVTLENCTLGGVNVTAENVGDLVSNTANATVK